MKLHTITNSSIKSHETTVNGRKAIVVTPDSDTGFTTRALDALQRIGFQYAGKDMLLHTGAVDKVSADLESISSRTKQHDSSVMEEKEYRLKAKRISFITAENEQATIDIYSAASGAIGLKADYTNDADNEAVALIEEQLNNAQIKHTDQGVEIAGASLKDIREALSSMSAKVETALDAGITSNGIVAGSASIGSKNYETHAELIVYPENSEKFSIKERLFITDRVGATGSYKQIKHPTRGQIQAFVIPEFNDGPKSEITLADKATALSCQLHELTGGAPAAIIAKEKKFFVVGDTRLAPVLNELSTSTREATKSAFRGTKKGNKSTYAASAVSKGVVFEQAYDALKPLLKPVDLTQNPELADPNRYRSFVTSGDIDANYAAQYYNGMHDAIDIFLGQSTAPFSDSAYSAASQMMSGFGVNWAAFNSDDFKVNQKGMLDLKSSRKRALSKDHWIGLNYTHGGDAWLTIGKNGRPREKAINLKNIAINHGYDSLRNFSVTGDIETARLKTQQEIEAQKQAQARRLLEEQEHARIREQEHLSTYQEKFESLDHKIEGSYEFLRKNVTPVDNFNLAIEKNGRNQTLHARSIKMTVEQKDDEEIASYQTIQRGSMFGPSQKLNAEGVSISESGLGTNITAVHAIGHIDPNEDFIIGEGVLDTYLNKEAFGSDYETANFIAATSAQKMPEVIRIAFDKSQGEAEIKVVSDNDLYKPEAGNVGMLNVYDAISRIQARGDDISNISLHYVDIGRAEDNPRKFPKMTDPSDVTTLDASTSVQAEKLKRLTGFEGIMVYAREVPMNANLGVVIDEVDKEDEPLTVEDLRSAAEDSINSNQPFLVSLASSAKLIKEFTKDQVVRPRELEQDLRERLLATAELAPSFLSLSDKIIDAEGVEVNSSHPLARAYSLDLGSSYLAVGNEIKSHTGDHAGVTATVDSVVMEVEEPDRGYEVGTILPITPNVELINGSIITIDGDEHLSLMGGATATTSLLADNKPVSADSEIGKNLGLTSDQVLINSDRKVVNLDGTPLAVNNGETYVSLKSNNKSDISYLAQGKAADAKIILGGDKPADLRLQLGAEISENNSASRWFRGVIDTYKTHLESQGLSKHDLTEQLLEFSEDLREKYSSRVGTQYEDRYIDAMEYVFKQELDQVKKPSFITTINSKETLQRFVLNSVLKEKPTQAESKSLSDPKQSLAKIIEFHDSFFFALNNENSSNVLRIQKLDGQEDNYLASFVNASGVSVYDAEMSKSDILSDSFVSRIKSIPTVKEFKNKEGDKVTSNIDELEPNVALKELGKKNHNPFMKVADTATYNEIMTAEKAKRSHEEAVSEAAAIESVETVLSKRSITGALLGNSYSQRHVGVGIDDGILKTPPYTLIEGFTSIRGGSQTNEAVFEKTVANFNKEIDAIKNGDLPDEIKTNAIAAQQYYRDTYIEKSKEILEERSKMHTSSKTGQSVGIIPNDLAFYKYVENAEGVKAIYPQAPYDYGKMANVATDAATSLAISLHDHNTASAKGLAESYTPFYSSTRMEWNLKQSDLDDIKDRWHLRSDDWRDTKLRFINFKEENQQFARIALHEYLSGSPIQAYKLPDLQNHKTTNDFVYRINSKAVSAVENRPFVKYSKMHDVIKDMLESKGIKTDGKIELLKIASDTYRVKSDKDFNPRQEFALKVHKDLVPEINQWLHDQKLLSVAEFGWINSRSEYQCPYQTSADTGRKESQDRAQLAEFAQNTPVMVRKDGVLVPKVENKEAVSTEQATKALQAEAESMAAQLVKNKESANASVSTPKNKL